MQDRSDPRRYAKLGTAILLVTALITLTVIPAVAADNGRRHRASYCDDNDTEDELSDYDSDDDGTCDDKDQDDDQDGARDSCDPRPVTKREQDYVRCKVLDAIDYVLDKVQDTVQ